MKKAEGEQRIAKILAVLDDDQIAELADEMLYDVEVDDYDGDYAKAFAQQAEEEGESLEDYVYMIIDKIYSFFEISVDWNGNVN